MLSTNVVGEQANCLKEIVAKASEGQRYPSPAGVVCDYEGGCRAAAPKGSMTIAFTHGRILQKLAELAEFGRIRQNLAEIGRNWQY